MTDPLTPAALRQLMVAADDLPDLSAAAWNKRRDAEQMLRTWRAWLPGLLDLIAGEQNNGMPGA